MDLNLYLVTFLGSPYDMRDKYEYYVVATDPTMACDQVIKSSPFCQRRELKSVIVCDKTLVLPENFQNKETKEEVSNSCKPVLLKEGDIFIPEKLPTVQGKRKQIDISVEICREDVTLPEYSNDGDAGLDIHAVEDVEIGIGETVIIPTGLKVAIPLGYEIQIRPRSGITFNTPLRVSNSPGTIDSNFRGEVGVIVQNTSYNYWFDQETIPVYDVKEKGNKNGFYKIKKGDRIAQLVLNEVPKLKWNQIDGINKIEGNRNGGFGSSGV